MAGARVLVHDVDSLELFMETLQAKRDELEALYDILGSETANQGEIPCFWIWMNLLIILVVLLQS